MILKKGCELSHSIPCQEPECSLNKAERRGSAWTSPMPVGGTMPTLPLTMPDKSQDDAIQVYRLWTVPATDLPRPGMALWSIPGGEWWQQLQNGQNYTKSGHLKLVRVVQSYRAIPQKNQNTPSSHIPRDGDLGISLEEVPGQNMLEKCSLACDDWVIHIQKGPSKIQIWPKCHV